METKIWWVAFQAKLFIGISHFEKGLANFAATIHCNDSLHGKLTVVTLTLAYFITRDELIQKSIYDTDDNIYIYSGCNHSSCNPWWRHQMETFSALLALCVGNSPVTGEFPAQRPVTRSFEISSDLRLSKRLSKQSPGWWFEMPLCSLWRHCNAEDAFGKSQVRAWTGKYNQHKQQMQ